MLLGVLISNLGGSVGLWLYPRLETTACYHTHDFPDQVLGLTHPAHIQVDLNIEIAVATIRQQSRQAAGYV